MDEEKKEHHALMIMLWLLACKCEEAKIRGCANDCSRCELNVSLYWDDIDSIRDSAHRTVRKSGYKASATAKECRVVGSAILPNPAAGALSPLLSIAAETCCSIGRGAPPGVMRRILKRLRQIPIAVVKAMGRFHALAVKSATVGTIVFAAWLLPGKRLG